MRKFANVSTHAKSAALGQQLLAEFVGTAALRCAVIGSGIMAQRLCGGNLGLELLTNTVATVLALYVLIETLGPISGAHLNPLVTLVLWSKRAVTQVNTAQAAIFFIAAQLVGAVAGALGFVLAQCLGAAVGSGLAHALAPAPDSQPISTPNPS